MRDSARVKCPRCQFKFKSPGQVKGGKLSRRTLTSEQARAMAKARAAK